MMSQRSGSSSLCSQLDRKPLRTSRLKGWAAFPFLMGQTEVGVRHLAQNRGRLENNTTDWKGTTEYIWSPSRILALAGRGTLSRAGQSPWGL